MIRRFFTENPVALPVYMPTLILAVGRGMLIPVLPLYAKGFQDSYGLIGIVLASQGVGTLLGDVPAGVLFGRLGQRYSMLLGLIVLAVATLGMGLAGSLWVLVLFGLLAGMGTALWNIARHAYLTDSSPVQRRGRAIAVFGGINRVGVFLGPFIGGILGSMVSLRAPLLLYGVLIVAAMIFPARFAQENSSTRAVHRGGLSGHAGHLLTMLRSHGRSLSTAGLGQFLAQTLREGRHVIIPLYAADIIGLDVGQIGVIVGLSSAIDMSLFYPAGLIMDNIGRKFAIVPCFTIMSIGMALIPLTQSFGALLAVAMLIGFGNGLGSGTMMTLGADLAPPDELGEYLGIWRLIGDSGHATAPMIVGGVAQVVGLVLAAYVIAGIGLGASAIFAGLVPETLAVRTVSPPDATK
jgi:MFS family permease